MRKRREKRGIKRRGSAGYGTGDDGTVKGQGSGEGSGGGRIDG